MPLPTGANAEKRNVLLESECRKLLAESGDSVGFIERIGEERDAQ